MAYVNLWPDWIVKNKIDKVGTYFYEIGIMSS